MLTAWNYVASDPLHHYVSPQGCLTHSMAIKHGTERWNLKKHAKRVFSKVDFVVFWTEKKVIGALIWCKPQ